MLIVVRQQGARAKAMEGKGNSADQSLEWTQQGLLGAAKELRRLASVDGWCVAPLLEIKKGGILLLADRESAPAHTHTRTRTHTYTHVHTRTHACTHGHTRTMEHGSFATHLHCSRRHNAFPMRVHF
jgi:hypothetical protein